MVLAILYDSLIEREQIELVSANGWAIKHMQNPAEAVQLAAINHTGYAIRYIRNPTQEALLLGLKSQDFIYDQPAYDRFIKLQFANNTLLMKKWLRYGQTMREV